MDCGNCSGCGQFCDFPECLPPFKRRQYEEEKRQREICPKCGKPWSEHDFGVPAPECP